MTRHSEDSLPSLEKPALATPDNADIPTQVTAVDAPTDAPASPSSSVAVQDAEEVYEYPEGIQVVIIMASILLALFLVALDRTIIATAIPKMTDEFHSIQDIGWYGSSFLLTSCALQLVLGRVYTFYTPKYVFLLLILVFEVGSALCGAAPNSAAFIVGRAIAGVGSAGIMSGGIILMTSTVPLAKRPKYQGLFGATFGVASILGPLVGGALTTNVTWRWCFYINLPIGGAAMIIIAFILKPTPGIARDLTLWQKLSKLDLLGEFFLLPSIICLLLALQWGGSVYAWNDGRIIALLVIFGVFFIGFVIVQILMPATATIPKSIISQRSIIAGAWFTFCLGSTMMINIYYVPIWFQAIQGVSAVQSGIDTLPMVLALVIGSILSGALIGKIGYYTPFVYASCILLPIGAGLISTFNQFTGTGSWIGHQIIFGVGLGLGMQQGSMAAQTVLSRAEVPTGVSIMFFAQTLGGAIFISVGQNLLSSGLVEGLTGVIHGLTPQDVVNTGATSLRSIVPDDQLDIVLVVYNNALRSIFYAGTAMAAIAVIGGVMFEWRSVKNKKGEPPSRPHSKHAPSQASGEEKV